MSDEFKIQCEACGTRYNDIEEVCPYCGTPQPTPELRPEEIYIEDEPYLPSAIPFLEDEGYLPPEEDDFYSEKTYPPPLYDDQHAYSPEGSFVDDNIFAGEGEEFELALTDEDEVSFDNQDEYDEPLDAYDGHDDAFELDLETDEDEGEEEEVRPRYRLRWRILLGCLGAFICISTLYGGLGVLAAYHGLQERAADIEAEAELHYQRGQENLAAGIIELAIAEFERALSLNPNLLLAREALREAQNISQSQPTPTSEARSAAAAILLEEAETALKTEDWGEALELLSQVRDLNPDYKTKQVSEFLYEASYQQGLALLEPNTIEAALQSFDQALIEQPEETDALLEQANASLYIAGMTALGDEAGEAAVAALQELYEQEADYLDVEKQLVKAYALFGDTLTAEEAWCLAEAQYLEAVLLDPDDTDLQAKAEESNELCAAETAPQARTTPTKTAASVSGGGTPPTTGSNNAVAATTATPAPPQTTSAGAGSGFIFYGLFNPNELRWEILSIPAGGGSPKLVVSDGTMPAISPNGQFMVYRSEAIDSEGFHFFDFASRENNRITIRRQDILPRWGSDNTQFIFVAQEPATKRWQVELGFADGKSDPLILRDGRTPDWSADNRFIAYQGSDAEGNNPGIYIVPFNGGETQRITTHESDRAPNFSPNGSQLVYMSTQSGNWDIYTVSTSGDVPRQLTTYGGNDGLPVWSPDGSKIAYVSDSGGSWGIYVISAAGGAPTKITTWDGNKRPDWLLDQISWSR